MPTDQELVDRLDDIEKELFYKYGLTVSEAERGEAWGYLAESSLQLLQAYRDINWLINNKGVSMNKIFTPQDYAEFQWEVPAGAVIHIGEEFVVRDTLTEWMRLCVAGINIVQTDDIKRWTRVPLAPPTSPASRSPKLPTRGPACIKDVGIGLLPDSFLSKWWDYGYLHEDGSWMLFCNEGIGFYTVQPEHIQRFEVVYPPEMDAPDPLKELS